MEKLATRKSKWKPQTDYVLVSNAEMSPMKDGSLVLVWTLQSSGHTQQWASILTSLTPKQWWRK